MLATAKAYKAGTVSPNPTSNYVVFDDKLIDILRKYSIPGLLGGSVAASPLDDLVSQ